MANRLTVKTVALPSVGEGYSEFQHNGMGEGVKLQPLTQQRLLKILCGPLPQGERAQ
jgi:hypothetical protein